MKIYYFHVDIGQDEKIEWYREEHEVLKKNDKFLCLDNNTFTTIQHTDFKNDREMLIEKVSLLDWTKFMSKFHKSFTLSLYTFNQDNQAAEGKMNRKLQRYINKCMQPYMSCLGAGVIKLYKENMRDY